MTTRKTARQRSERVEARVTPEQKTLLERAAALVRQYFLEGRHLTGHPAPAHALTSSAALVRATFMNGTRNLTGGDNVRPRPSNT